jgi:hypothetical protein
VLLRIEDRNEHVEVSQQVAQTHPTVKLDGETAALAPLWELLIKRMLDRMHAVAKRLEQPAQDLLATGAGDRREAGAQRQRLLRQLGPLRAAAGERRAEDARDRHAQERGADIGAVVDLLVEPWEAHAAANQSYGVDVEQQRCRASLLARLRIEDVRLPERQRERLQPLRVLVQQVAEVGGRRACGRDRQQHRLELDDDARRRPPGYL